MEQLTAEGAQAMAQLITALMNLAMRMEREQFLGAGHHERAVGRRGYASGTKPELIDTLAGTLGLKVPKTTGTDEPFYPQALAQGRLCGQTLVPCGHAGDRRDVCVGCLDTATPVRVMAQFGLKGLSSTQISWAAKRLIVRGCGDPAPHNDDELEAWRGRALGEIRYLFLDASSREIPAGRRGA